MPQVGYMMTLPAHKRLQEITARVGISQIALFESFLLAATEAEIDRIVKVGQPLRTSVKVSARVLRKTARDALKKMKPEDLAAFIAAQTPAVAIAK